MPLPQGQSRPTSQMLFGKKHVFLWEVDHRTGCFMASADETMYYGGHLWTLKRFEDIFPEQSPTAESHQSRSTSLSFRFGMQSAGLRRQRAVFRSK